jgi:hypothetical protein
LTVAVVDMFANYLVLASRGTPRETGE